MVRQYCVYHVALDELIHSHVRCLLLCFFNATHGAGTCEESGSEREERGEVGLEIKKKSQREINEGRDCEAGRHLV